MSSQELISHYQSLLAEHGPCSKAVQWADDKTQRKRFEVLSEISESMESVLDVGCGLGHYYTFLRNTGRECVYEGVDIVPEFIDIANQMMSGDISGNAVLIDTDGDLPKGHDFGILSGAFNNAMDDNWGFMTSMLRKMYGAANKGIAFNALTSHVDYVDDGLFYVDPTRVIDFCKIELGGHPILRHDYTLRPNGFPFEFSVYVYKKPQY